MTRFTKSIYLLLLVGLAAACNAPETTGNSNAQNTDAPTEAAPEQTVDGWVTLPSGLMYKILRKGTGPKPLPGQLVKVHYKGILQDQTQFDSSYDRGQPIAFPLGENRVIPCWEEGIALLPEGSKAYLFCPSRMAYQDIERPGIPANSDLTFEVELLKVMDAPKPYDITGVTPQVTESGIEIYVVETSESGQFPLPGQKVSMNYSGYLTNGNKFDSNINHGRPFSFTVGQGQVIKGWDEAIRKLQVGEKARWVIPSELAYGDGGFGNVIPPNANLIFDVELLEINAAE
ncbi:MAG: FKBP-type peptidyl-prolyl cis-trans isomerase [Salibacteraceae bacterium]